MAIKRVLVPLSGTMADTVPLETAISVVRLFNGHLEALFLKPELQRSMRDLAEPGGAFDPKFVREVITDIGRAAEQARIRFEGIVQNHGLTLGDDPAFRPAASWHAAVGYGPETFARHGGFVDLIVIGRPVADTEPASSILDVALFTTGHPLLITPSAVPTQLPGRVLVGWNGTVQSERAIVRALPFLQHAREVVLFAVLTGAKRGPTAADAARYLAWHDVAAVVKEVSPSDRAVGAVLLEEAAAMGADLLVMGGYSHSRLREMILGGVTRHVLGHAELPVLMAH